LLRGATGRIRGATGRIGGATGKDPYIKITFGDLPPILDLWRLYVNYDIKNNN